MKVLRSAAVQKTLSLVLAVSAAPYVLGPWPAQARSVEALTQWLGTEIGLDPDQQWALRQGASGCATAAQFVWAVLDVYTNRAPEIVGEKRLTRQQRVRQLRDRISELGGWPVTPSDLCTASPLSEVTVRTPVSVIQWGRASCPTRWDAVQSLPVVVVEELPARHPSPRVPRGP